MMRKPSTEGSQFVYDRLCSWFAPGVSGGALGGDADVGDDIANSIRFNAADSPKLTKTFSGAGNQKTWTLSFWLKHCNVGTPFYALSAGADASNYSFVSVGDTPKFQFVQRDSAATTDDLTTSEVYRDPSAHYHFVLRHDTTDATEANRLTMEVNGRTIAAFSTANYPVQNVDDDIMGTAEHAIGLIPGGSTYGDVYLSEMIFVDGQNLASTNFARVSPQTGEWVPKTYAGTFGTNGFYLDFAIAPGTGNGAGQDVSGNSNHFTESGLASNDQTTDTPTNNYCTLNPLFGQQATAVESNGNLHLNSNGNGSSSRGTFGLNSGKWYFEFTPADTPSSMTIGIVNGDINSITGAGATLKSAASAVGITYTYEDDKTKNNNATSAAYGNAATFTSADVIGCAFDIDNGAIWFHKNGVWVDGNGTDSSATVLAEIIAGTTTSAAYSSGIAGDIWYPAIGLENTGDADVNFGQQGFAYTIPTGFLAINTVNLPEPTILDPSDQFSSVLYTGTGAELAVSGVGFTPDFTWIKRRSAVAVEHVLTDIVRGVTKEISSDAPATERTVAQGLKSFDTDGFTLGTDGSYNLSADTYVAWNWKGDGTAGVSNSDGTTTTTVNANDKAGFSILTYSGTGAAATIGHGLSAAPDMIIIRSLSNGHHWQVYHRKNTSAPETDYLRLNTAEATFDSAGPWGDTAPGASVITLGTAAEVNQSGGNYICYCFRSIEGYSKAGSYIGNANADGPFVYCGFRPAFVLIKSSTSADNWFINTAAISPYNVIDDSLQPNTTAAEGTASTNDIDYTSNGFKIRDSDTNMNGSGSTYIFMAFAESPFKYARAR